MDASACTPVRSATSRTAESLTLLGFGEFGIGSDPAQVKQRSLGLAHLLSDGAVADRLPRLPLEGVDLGGKLNDDIFEPRQVLLGGAQAKLGLVAAGVQARNACGLFKHAPALFRLGLDDLADAALMNQRRRARAGRGVGKQQVHVAGAHLAAVYPVGRALIALDPARTSMVSCSLNCAGALRALLSIWIATSALLRAGPVVGAGEDHVIHVGRAQRFVRGFPITQRNASTRLDLPQPFGPTTPVSPGSIRKSVGSTKDLKPSRRSRVSFMLTLFQS